MAPIQLQYGVLIDEMKTFDTTNGWDVIVSYDEEKINNLLKTVKGHGPTQFPDMVVESYDPINDEIVKTVYKLNVNNPVLQFSSDRGTAKLEYELNGTFGPKNTKVPEGTKMLLDVEIASLKGETTNTPGDSGFKPNANELRPQGEERYKQGPNYVVDVSQKDTARGVCLVFRDTRVDLTNPSTDPKVTATINRIRADIVAATADHLNKSTYYYFIAGLTVPRRASRDVTTVTLQPKSFCFTLLPGDDEMNPPAPGTLVMWIGVEGGNNNGQHPGGSTSLTFHPGSRDVNPIPQKNTASIIFSHDLLAREFIKKALESKFDEVKILSRKGSEGMKFSGKMRNEQITFPDYKERTENAISFVEYYFQGVNFSADTPETTIEIASKISTKSDTYPVKVSYKSPQQKCKWHKYWYAPTGMRAEEGTASLDFELDGEGWWEGSTNPSKPNNLSLKFREKNDLIVKATADKPPWWSPAGSGQLPSYYDQLFITLNLNVAIGNLDYFLTTNLLFPGQHIFIADPPKPDSNYDHGLGVPRDLILTGQVADKLKASQLLPPSSRSSCL